MGLLGGIIVSAVCLSAISNQILSAPEQKATGDNNTAAPYQSPDEQPFNWTNIVPGLTPGLPSANPTFPK